MLLSLVASLSAACLASGSVMRRAPLNLPKEPSNPPDPGMQSIPATAKADNTFNNGAPMLAALPDPSDQTPPPVYGARGTDLPFSRLFHGNAKFFSAGQLNTPDGKQDKWVPDGQDYATQSACGIPDNAFSISKVAIHPYFLKYADLSRYCMQDVCISFWKEDGSSDMMLKVTDICSTDPNDPTHCATPADIKIDRTKASIMEKLTANPITSYPELMGDQYPEKIWWFFTKCWADGLPQPAYMGNNWFTEPALPNNLDWSQTTGYQQWLNNNATYAAKGWQTYPNGAYNPQRDDTTSPPINDWAPGDPTPSWQPVAGGKGWGMPNSSGPPAAELLVNSTKSGKSSDPVGGSSKSPASASAAAAPASSGAQGSASVPAPAASTSAAVSAQDSGEGSAAQASSSSAPQSPSAEAPAVPAGSGAQSSASVPAPAASSSGAVSAQGNGEGSAAPSSSSSAPQAPSTGGNGTLVALWEPCSFPSQGINGPLPCVEGAECICKDTSYAQCRTQIDGSWAPPDSHWQCQKPGDVATGLLDEEEECSDE